MGSSSNLKGNIRLFWKTRINFTILLSTDQYISVMLDVGGIDVVIFFVHSSYDANIRQILWNEFIAFNSNSPWMIIGDFNTIADQSEKRGSI